MRTGQNSNFSGGDKSKQANHLETICGQSHQVYFGCEKLLRNQLLSMI